MKIMRKITAVLIFIGLFLCPNLSVLKTFAAEDSTAKLQSGVTTNAGLRKYFLGPNDVLDISVIGFPDFKQENVRVQPDGNILLAPLGTISVQGMTMEQLQNLLTQKYEMLIKNPMISINLVKTKPLIVYITGAVLSPGSYELNTDTSYSNSFTSLERTTVIERKTPLLSNMLVAAGGITPDADLENVEITNRYDSKKYKINLLELVSNGNTNEDIYLTSGDVVYIPRLPSNYAVDFQKYNRFATSTFARKQIPVRVLGYVKNAGFVNIDANNSPRLNTAISMAGGYLEGTTHPPKHVIVSRMDENGRLTSSKVNPMKNDIVLLPNDVIFVPEKLSSSVARGFDYLFRLVSPVSSFATGYNNMDYVFDR